MIIQIIGRREDKEKGVNTHYMLSDGKIYTREEVIVMWRHRLLPGYHIDRRDGLEDLRDTPHTKENESINHQPLI
jgi:hypothetical protein